MLYTTMQRLSFINDAWALGTKFYIIINQLVIKQH